MLPLDPVDISTPECGQGCLSRLCQGTAKIVTRLELLIHEATCSYQLC